MKKEDGEETWRNNPTEHLTDAQADLALLDHPLYPIPI